METPPLKLGKNNESKTKEYVRKALTKDEPSGMGIEDKVKKIQEEGRKEEEAIQRKEFEGREARHAKRTEQIMELLKGEGEDEEVLYHPTAPESEGEGEQS